MRDKTPPKVQASVTVSLRAPRELIEALDRAAEASYRSRTSLVLQYLDNGLREDGWLGEDTEEAPSE